MLVAPDDPRIIGEYGKVLAQRGRSADAAAFLSRAVQLQPNDWMLYSALGVVEDQLGDHEKARTAYGNALRLNPGEPSVLNNFALSRMLAGDLQMAASLAAEAAAKGGSDPKIAANQDMIAGMLRARGETVGPPQAAGQQSAVPKPVQPVAVQHLPSPAIASGAPKPLVAAAATTGPTAAPRVVMQKVPFDPYAGPVKSSVARAKEATHPPRALAHEAAPQLKKRVVEEVAPKAPIPALRTAAD
jgi:tetratricopeptide (TPR) repeat protein